MSELEEASIGRERSGLRRRDVLVNAAAIGAGVALGPPWFAACSDQSTDIAKGGDHGLERGGDHMKTRRLGTLEVSEMGAGCMSISANYGPPADKAQGIDVIRTAHEKGVNHLNENCGAINVQLTSADLRGIDTAVSGITVQGGRMNQDQMHVVDQSA